MKPFTNSWENPTSTTRNEIVFANRNHLYGAYVLRQNYEKLVARAFILTSIAFILLFFIPAVIKWMNPSPAINTPDKDQIFELTPDVIKKPEEFHPPAKIPPITSSTVRSPILVITDDIMDDHPPEQNPNSNANTGMYNDTSTTSFVEDFPDVDSTFKEPTYTLPDVQEIPAFPGGTSAMMNYLISHIHYPPDARDSNIHGTVYISFVIDKEGSLTDANVMHGIGGGCDEEALRVVRSMPSWTPGKQNGRAVMVRLILPVQFSLR